MLYCFRQLPILIIGEYNSMLRYTNIMLDVFHCLWYNSDTQHFRFRNVHHNSTNVSLLFFSRSPSTSVTLKPRHKYTCTVSYWEGCCHSSGGYSPAFHPGRSGCELSVGHVGFVVDKVALGRVFSEYLGSPFYSFHRLLHTHHHPSSLGQRVTDVQIGLSQPNPRNKTKQKAVIE
jgi:hypothetical protein